MLRLAADNDVDERLLQGLFRRRPWLELVRVRDVGLRTAPDPLILAWTAARDRILVSGDRRTMKDHAYARVRTGQSMPGIFLLRRGQSMGRLIAAILFVDDASEMADWRNQVEYLPL